VGLSQNGRMGVRHQLIAKCARRWRNSERDIRYPEQTGSGWQKAKTELLTPSRQMVESEVHTINQQY
jgi:hypothetical protein